MNDATPLLHVTAPPDARRLAVLDTSWARRRQDVSTRIEEAALALFVERGIDAVTVEEIAGAAGLSRRTFYRYFGSPEDIVFSVLCRMMDAWSAAVRSQPVTEPLIDSVRRANIDLAGSITPNQPPILILDLLAASSSMWMRVAGRVHAHVAKGLHDILSVRLAHLHQDTDRAGAVAAALSAMIMHLVEAGMREGRHLALGEMENGLIALARLIDLPESKT